MQTAAMQGYLLVSRDATSDVVITCAGQWSTFSYGVPDSCGRLGCHHGLCHVYCPGCADQCQLARAAYWCAPSHLHRCLHSS